MTIPMFEGSWSADDDDPEELASDATRPIPGNRFAVSFDAQRSSTLFLWMVMRWASKN